MDQVVYPTNLSMHVIQACDLVGKVGLNEAVPVSPVEFFVAFSPVEKGLSKILASNFDLCVQLIAWCAARGSAFIEGCVWRASHRLIVKRRCLALAVYVSNVAQIENASLCYPHNFSVQRAQEVVASSLADHETQRDAKDLHFEFGIFLSERVNSVCPKLIGWLHSECLQMLEFIDSHGVMFVLLHIIWLPQRLWSTNLIVAGRWTRPTLRVLQIVLVAIIVGTIIVGVIVVFLFEVGS